ncbi:alpha-hydroxy-acid oxidizing enzyme [Izhakiella australiensis]|uniref:Alpha-hydroxy-acid oxidizing enzyme n=1 Tax=Izhakiella australiensis TaxID=1926881 RepID=A0A1S8YLS9_9GAMM|nr:alpha-hydroxy acid oxidase [Izhakiella australiensis]OON39825.1 alpha-hydroxy-acid oxidizing enzyme [Izhakiella australiensis]
MTRTITCIDDLQQLARRRVPKLFYDYIDSGSWTESTYRENSGDLARLHFRQRVGCNVENITTSSTVLGTPVSLPLILAPTGLAGMIHPDGEILAARAAAAAGVPYTLSTVSICSIEDVAARLKQPFWFQLYMMKDRTFIADLIARADAAGCSTLVLTLDLPIQGQRHKDIRNGLSVPPTLTLSSMLSMLSHPRWCAAMLKTPRRTFGNIVGYAKGVNDTLGFADWVSRQFDRSFSWQDIDWVRQRWNGKLVIKGVMDSDDARQAFAAGADAIVVSNHGGRQLDGAPSSISVLARIADQVAGRGEIIMDSGIRSGQDMVRALAMGADSLMVGRAFLYGLGALGEEGVTLSLTLLRKELEATMALCGVTRIADLTPDNIVDYPWPLRSERTSSSPVRLSPALPIKSEG